MNTAQHSVESTAQFVLLLDEMPMRRAQLEAFLSRWAALERVKLMASGMPGAEQSPEIAPDCRMLILSVGGLVLDRSPVLHHVQVVAENHHLVPVVLLAEAGSTRDAAAAFRAGARGYIPASIEPEVALRALSFILHGGHFFPPTALRAPRTPGDGGADDGPKLKGAVIGAIFRVRNGGSAPRRGAATP